MKFKNYIKQFKPMRIEQKRIADAIGCSIQLVNSWSSQHRNIHSRYWKKLVELTGGQITISDLLNDKE